MTEKTDLVRILERIQSAATAASRFVGGDARVSLVQFAHEIGLEIDNEIEPVDPEDVYYSPGITAREDLLHIPDSLRRAEPNERKTP